MTNVLKEIGGWFSDTFGKIKEFLSSGGGVLSVMTATFSSLTGIQQLMLLLLMAIFVDLVTGIMAYHYEWRESGKPPHKGYLIQSSKLRQTYTKGASYLLLIGLVYWMSSLIFADVQITLGGVLKPLTIVEFFTATLIGIEAWSNLENLKRMNIDILGTVTRVISKGWEIFNGAKKGQFNKNGD